MYVRIGIYTTALLFIFTTFAQEVVVDFNALVEADLDAKECALMHELGFGSYKTPSWRARIAFGIWAKLHGIPLTQSAIQEQFFSHLSSAFPEIPSEAIPYQDSVLPLLMCQWLAEQTSAPALAAFNSYLRQSTLSDEQKRFYQAVSLITFNAPKFAQTSRLNPDTIEFIRSCRYKKIPVHLVGNINKECLDALEDRFGCFSLFGLPFFSHQTHLLKPSASFYAAFNESAQVQNKRIWCIESSATYLHIAADQEYLHAHPNDCIVAHSKRLNALAKSLVTQK